MLFRLFVIRANTMPARDTKDSEGKAGLKDNESDLRVMLHLL